MTVTASRDQQAALTRMKRQARLNLGASLLMLAGFVFLWRLAHLSGWFTVVGVLLLVEALGYVVFVNRLTVDLNFWRRNWLQVMTAFAIWSVAADVVARQISSVFGAALTAFTCFWIAVGLLIYVGIRRRRSSA